MINIFAIVISLLLFALASSEDSIEIASAGMFFLALGIGGLLKSKYMILFIGLSLLPWLILQLVTGEVFSRRFDNILLAQDPDTYWQHILIFSIIVFGTIFYGFYNAFYKKEASISNTIENRSSNPHDLLTEKERETTDAFVKNINDDLELVTELLLADQSSKALKEKSAMLMEALYEKYKNDDLAQPSLEIIKKLFVEEIQKREKDESGRRKR